MRALTIALLGLFLALGCSLQSSRRRCPYPGCGPKEGMDMEGRARNAETDPRMLPLSESDMKLMNVLASAGPPSATVRVHVHGDTGGFILGEHVICQREVNHAVLILTHPSPYIKWHGLSRALDPRRALTHVAHRRTVKRRSSTASSVTTTGAKIVSSTATRTRRGDDLFRVSPPCSCSIQNRDTIHGSYTLLAV